MAYNVILSLRAQKEIENAIEYYALHSNNAPIDFIERIKAAYDTLATNPLFRIRYKNIRALKIKQFPYSLYFIIHEESKTVRILSCFHNRIHPNKRPGL